jgi:hypothetical protein
LTVIDTSDAEMRRIERASDTIDRFIESRAAEKSAANREAEAHRLAVVGYHSRRLSANRAAWAEYHRHRAALFEDLAQHHRDALGKIIDGAGV